MRVTAAIGPGHHGGVLRLALRRLGVPYRAVTQWPELTVEDWSGAGDPVSRTHAWYSLQRRIVWGAWRRVPFVRRWQTPRVLDCATFDVAASRALVPADLFIGWSQVSLRSMARARALGAVTLLEHPMTHVDYWRAAMDAEYARWPTGGAERYSVVPGLLAARMRSEYRRADYISVLSSFAERSFLEAGVEPRRLVQLPLGVDPRRFSPGGEDRSGPFRLLFVGRLELLKGVQYLLEAVRPLGNVEVWLVGPRLAEADEVLRRLGGPQVKLLGQAGEDLVDHYRRADALVFPSINDAFGLAILEAMACGLPVIATDHSGGPDILDEGEDGFVVPARDALALRERIAFLAEDRRRAREMGAAARRKVLSRYTLDNYADRLAATIAKLTNARAAADNS
jgi:glycosyltransferase involved in cell wall biosynthesis